MMVEEMIKRLSRYDDRDSEVLVWNPVEKKAYPCTVWHGINDQVFVVEIHDPNRTAVLDLSGEENYEGVCTCY